MFCRDTKREWYLEIEHGKNAEWKMIENGNVFCGKENSAVWVYKIFSSVSEYAWRFLKMDPMRLEALYQRIKVHVKKGRKPFHLHGEVDEL